MKLLCMYNLYPIPSLCRTFISCSFGNNLDVPLLPSLDNFEGFSHLKVIKFENAILEKCTVKLAQVESLGPRQNSPIYVKSDLDVSLILSGLNIEIL